MRIQDYLHDSPIQVLSGLTRGELAVLAAGGMLLIKGLSRGGVVGTLLGAVGAMMVYRKVQPLLQSGASPSRPAVAAGPTGSRDAVEEASWESFPASDAPGY